MVWYLTGKQRAVGGEMRAAGRDDREHKIKGIIGRH